MTSKYKHRLYTPHIIWHAGLYYLPIGRQERTLSIRMLCTNLAYLSTVR